MSLTKYPTTIVKRFDRNPCMPEKKPKKTNDISISTFFADEAAKGVGGFEVEYLENLKNAVKEANAEVAQIQNTFGNNDVASLGGFFAEIHQAGTFNINAAFKGVSERVSVPHSNDYASPDIQTSWLEEYSSKYYKTALDSAKAQTERTWQSDYQDLKFEGQSRLIPGDQLKDAQTYADHKIAKELDNRPDVAKDWQDTRDHLTDRIKSPSGVESDPLTKQQSLDAARLIKEGKPIEFEAPDKFNWELHSKEIGEAAVSAAAISVVVSSAPVILGNLVKVYKNKDYDWSEYLGDLGSYAKNEVPAVAGDAFLKAAVAGSLTSAAKNGVLGESFQNISPGVIAVISVSAVESAKALWKYQQGELTGEQAASEAFKAGLKSSAALAGKIAGQALIPIPVVGALIGSMVVSFVLDKGINEIENPRAMAMYNLIYDTFESQNKILSNVFTSNVDYITVYNNYNEMIYTNRLILLSQDNIIDSNERINHETRIQSEVNDEIVKSLERRNNLF